jgi:hypothetical protein
MQRPEEWLFDPCSGLCTYIFIVMDNSSMSSACSQLIQASQATIVLHSHLRVSRCLLHWVPSLLFLTRVIGFFLLFRKIIRLLDRWVAVSRFRSLPDREISLTDSKREPWVWPTLARVFWATSFCLRRYRNLLHPACRRAMTNGEEVSGTTRLCNPVRERVN